MVTPPTVPSKKPGNTRVVMTRLTAAPELFDTRAAMARIAISPIQSPKLEMTCASHRRKNDLVPNTRHIADGTGGVSASGGMKGAPAGCSSAIRGAPSGVGGWESSLRGLLRGFLRRGARLLGGRLPRGRLLGRRPLGRRFLRDALGGAGSRCTRRTLTEQLDRLVQRHRFGVDAAGHRRVERPIA